MMRSRKKMPVVSKGTHTTTQKDIILATAAEGMPCQNVLSDIVYTPAGVQMILKIGRSQTYELFKNGTIPAKRIGRKIRVRVRDVDAFLSASDAHEHN